MMYLALTYDHRLLDGREAVTVLVKIKVCPGRNKMDPVAHFLSRNTLKIQQRCCYRRLALSTASSVEREISLPMKHEKLRRHEIDWLLLTQASPMHSEMHSSFSASGCLNIPCVCAVCSSWVSSWRMSFRCCNATPLHYVRLRRYLSKSGRTHWLVLVAASRYALFHVAVVITAALPLS